MPRITRRKFIHASAVAGLGTALGGRLLHGAPTVLTAPRTAPSTAAGRLTFLPAYVQSGRGPHLLDWAYASDHREDAFLSDITSTRDGVTISDTKGVGNFCVNVRWNVEGFGYLFLTADNSGRFYELPPSGTTSVLNLNYELAASRVSRNERRMAAHGKNGWVSSREASAYHAISRGYLEDAGRANADARKCGELSQKALLHALRASEAIEIEAAASAITRRGHRPEFSLGCDARGFYQMDHELFLERFTEVFTYATITHVWKGEGAIEDFEPREGELRWGMRDLVFTELRKRNITIEGRPLFWFHTWVTPDWLKTKTFDELLRYVERTTREVVGHHGDGMYAWEIVNELHDWANECRLTPEQTVELTKFACEVARDTAPRVHRLVNNCCPYAEYVQLKQWSGQEAKYPQRTPWQFTRDLVDAGVDFTILAQQMYFPYRDLQDIIILLERFEEFGKPIHLSEVGAPGGPTEESVKLKKVGFPKEPYIWHRHWDEELQADWLEAVFTLAYSRSAITGAHWFDFVDPHSYLDNGGLFRSPRGEPKAAYDRLQKLVRRFRSLPSRNQ